MPPVRFKSLLIPPSVTLGIHDFYQRSSVHSMLDLLGGLDLESIFRKDQIHGHAPYCDNIVFPSFEVRETSGAYFLEGNFTGTHNPNDIIVEKLGSKGLLFEVQARVPSLS